MRILFVAAEATPLVKVGGLADVVGSLPLALASLGHEVRVMIPAYGCINVSRYPTVPVKKNDFKITAMPGQEPQPVRVALMNRQVPTYLIQNSLYFGDDRVYSDNDLERFLFFSRAVFEILPHLEWQPEIVHFHDWHAALGVMWLKEAHLPYATVFTIHNLAYQGFFDDYFLARSGLKEHWEVYSNGRKLPYSFMSQGIQWADLVTTVSETYAREIVTPRYGEGLDVVLRARQRDLLGIVNGIDYEVYNPETDPYLKANYGPDCPEKRVDNKLALQERAGLLRSAEIPLLGMAQRLDEQKGFDILVPAMDHILQQTSAQFVILGRGREHYENELQKIAARYPQRMALFLGFDDPLAHLIYAASDMFLMPSRFEPCGLGQLIAMHYGALPIVRHTGGLVDTVSGLTTDLKEGSGFVFEDYTSDALIDALESGVESYINNKEAWLKAMQRVLQLDFSWRSSARKYETAYERVLKMKG